MSIHNLWHFQRLMADIRFAIAGAAGRDFSFGGLWLPPRSTDRP
ncbi:MAG: hypothetical protein KF705_10805 [Phycisphaeraceae bacterium]|nr:hypothetical protein [Phycisphaeraceae bacterium]